MRKLLAVLAAVVLTAVALFLPSRLSQWGDRALLGEVNILQEEEREGFAESAQLTVGEKLLLLRSGALDALAFNQNNLPSGLFSTTDSTAKFYIENAEQAAGYDQEMLDKWERRISKVYSELRALQAMGGMPALWSADSELECLDLGQVFYMDRDTQTGFMVDYMYISGAPYSLNLTVDDQTGRILSFELWWTGDDLNWGLRSASGFGGAWRDYWGMDSVAVGWYNEYTKSILEDTVAVTRRDGDYNANGQVIFAYEGQTLGIPLLNQAIGGRYMLRWNL